MTTGFPLGIAGWLQRYASGADLAAELHPLAARMAAADPAIWIRLASACEIDAQIERLVAACERAGSRSAAMAALPLFGVPFVVKDNIDIAGVPTTAACAAYARIAPANATVVGRLLDSGAVWMAKSNLDQFATGLVGTRSPWGSPSSALQPERISGGSSSGSAVAVALGLVPFALGTDTAGSGRVPAGFNNVTGLKPTPGRVSGYGVVPACRTLDCVSVFALLVRDAASVLAVIEGADPLDPLSCFRPTSLPAESTPGVTGALRFGIPDEVELAEIFRDPWSDLLGRLTENGQAPTKLDFRPLHAVGDRLYQGPWVAERLTVVEQLLRTAPEALDPIVRNVISGAHQFSAADAFRSGYELASARQTLNEQVWASCDVLLVPTAPEHPSITEVAADPIGRNSRLGRYTSFVNLLGWCAVAIPAGFTVDGSPFGVTLIAPAGRDAMLAEVADAWQRKWPLPLGATGVLDDGVDCPRPWARHQDSIDIAVLGAHLTGMPLNGQLVQAGARLRSVTTTASQYRLYALANTTPPKPGLLRVVDGGRPIVVEVWTMPATSVGRFLAQIPPPLGLGNLELIDGTWVKGFICEPAGLAGAEDITDWGGWRAWVQRSGVTG